MELENSNGRPLLLLTPAVGARHPGCAMTTAREWTAGADDPGPVAMPRLRAGETVPAPVWLLARPKFIVNLGRRGQSKKNRAGAGERRRRWDATYT